jgi:hypothetical protein
MNKIKINSKDWVQILKFEEVYSLLDFKDLENLSFICKNVYFKTKPLLLSKIFLHSNLLINNLSDESYWYNNDSVNICEDMLLKYKDSVQSISIHIKSVKVDEIPLYPELHQYLDLFINLEILHFCNPKTEVNLASLNIILTKSLKLKELILFSITILANEISDANIVLLPPTLTVLSINYCIWPDYYQNLLDNSIAVPIYGPYTLLLTQKFPNLINFEYSSSELNDDFNPTSSILKNSPILRTLNLEAKFLSREIFDLIHRSTSLKSIGLMNNEGVDIKPEDFSNHSSYPTVTKFCYLFFESQSYSLTNVGLLSSRFPNLKTLGLLFEIPFPSYFNSILGSIPNLQKLNLYNIGCFEYQLPLSLVNRTITTLTIFNFKVDQINFKDFEEWYALKSIKMNFNSFSITDNDYKLVKDRVQAEMSSNWIVFSYTEDYIRLCKK